MKIFVVYGSLAILSQSIFYGSAYALTSGPAQEEFTSFEPLGTTDMVDLYSGDFVYNLPLLAVPGPNGGYPVNLAYHSGIGMEQEASWAGLGWNVNVGAINRGLRGLPDDLNGANVIQINHMRDNVTVSLDVPRREREVFGFPIALNKLNYQVYYNNYTGIGYRVNGLGLQIPYTPIGLSLGIDSQDGLSPSVNIGANISRINFGMSLTTNSRRAMKQLAFSSGVTIAKATNKKITQGTNKEVVGLGISNSSSLSFSAMGPMPSGGAPRTTTSVPFELKISTNLPAWGIANYKIPVYGSVTTSNVQSNVSTPAFGYFNTHGASDLSLTDYREKPLVYSKKIPNLAPSSLTYDLFNISGQGTGGMFRGHRPEIGIYTPARLEHTFQSHRGNLEIGVKPPFYHVGVGYTGGSSSETVSGWSAHNQLEDDLFFKGKVFTPHANHPFPGLLQKPKYQPAFFKVYGEKSTSEGLEGQYEHWRKDQPIRVRLGVSGAGNNMEYAAVDRFDFKASGGMAYNAAGNYYNRIDERTQRGTNIHALTEEEASVFGMTRQYQYRDPSGTLKNLHNHNQVPEDQIAEISVYQADGMRYTYGLPAMNRLSEDAQFRLPEDPVPVSASASQEHNYTLVKDWNNGTFIHKEKGSTNTLDEYISRTLMPPYAHSWLLTSTVSNDYVDSDDIPGPSENDLGYWVKFNYQQKISNYQWRVPYTDANYVAGSLSNPKDNIGTYSYGTKDIFYVESIETKTHIAIFELEQRHDGYESSGKFGSKDDANEGRGSRSLYALKKIRLYTKADYQDGTNPNAVPIKTVHFTYDYSLCPNVPNNNGQPAGIDLEGNIGGSPDINLDKGKLTLKQLHFTYQNNEKGALSPYQFTYSSNNPPYDFRNMDRWGNYKPNTVSAVTDPDYPYIYFPYTDQQAPPMADAWHLTAIRLPSGGQMKIEYEPDDYTRVERKPAMQMFDIRGIGDDAGASQYLNSSRWDPATIGDLSDKDPDDNYRVYFELNEPITAADPHAYLRDHYLRNIEKVFFKTHIKLRDDNWDLIQGYADISLAPADYGVVPGTNIAWITLLPEPIGKINITGTQVHPFRSAAFEFLRTARQDLVFGQANNNIINPASLITVYKDVVNIIAGFHMSQLLGGRAKDIRLNGQSVIRLYSPEKKYGGGARVAKLFIEESGFATGTGTNQYGNTYQYEMEDGSSSGIAYEPQIGREESALVQPINYPNSTFAKGPGNLFIEEPIMEEYYPGASVGYRRVEIKSLTRSNDITWYDPGDPADILNETASKMSYKTALPNTIYEFYTPYEFPVKVDQTDITAHPTIFNLTVIPGLFTEMKAKQARSQGYSVILNDMAGKTRRIKSFVPANPINPDSEELVISEQEFIYHTVNEFNPDEANYINNKVPVFDKDGKIEDAILGQDHDIFVSMKESRQESSSLGLDLNVEIWFPSPAFGAPLILPIPLPNFSNTEMSFKTAVTNKVIYKSGLVHQVRTFDGTSRLVQENLYYDAVTGQPIVSRTINEFEDDIFDANIPAHWHYEGMEGNFRNLGASFEGVFLPNDPSDGSIHFAPMTDYDVREYFTVGDELLINGHLFAHVWDIRFEPPEDWNSGDDITEQDTDGDGIPDIDDPNPEGLPDSDCDSIPDYLDPCDPILINPGSGGGDPILTHGGSGDPNDTDGDTVPNDIDECDTEPGPVSTNGCPDTDCDGTADIYDACPLDPGPPSTDGCPDCDCDDIADTVDPDFPCETGLPGNGNGGNGNNGNNNNGGGNNNSGGTTPLQSYIRCIDPDGNYFDAGGLVTSIKIINSGYKNRLNDYVGSLVTKKDPENGGTGLSNADITGLEVLQLQAVEMTDRWRMDCGQIDVCGYIPDNKINPFLHGIRGIWRSKRSYNYLTERANNGDLRQDGIFEEAHLFNWASPQQNHPNWKLANTMTKFSPSGYEIENRDVLGNYSAALYGYGRSFVTAVGNNTQYIEMLYDGFEDYAMKHDCSEDHWAFQDQITLGSLTDESAHTGAMSYKVPVDPGNVQSESIGIEVIPAIITHQVPGGGNGKLPVNPDKHETPINEIKYTLGQPCFSETFVEENDDERAILLQDCGCNGRFNPYAGKQYFLSLWAKEVHSGPLSYAYLVDLDNPKVRVSFYKAGGSYLGARTFIPRGQVIEGWQKLEGLLAIPPETVNMVIEFQNTGQRNADVYYDDLRIHPNDANMRSFVYDLLTLKTTAELDNNNYATYYIYDEEGKLIQAKKETIEGIKTITEGRSGQVNVN